MRARSILPVAALVVLAVAGCTSAAEPSEVPAEDTELLSATRSQFEDPDDRVALAVVDASGARTAFVNADADTVFEIGSITKVLTGELFAMAIERGEVAPGDRVGDYLDLGDSPAADATLEQLATHSSGLPIFPTDPVWMAGVQADLEADVDPFDENLDEMLALAGTTPVDPARTPAYSNMGAALLGQALAAAAGQDYASLLRERLLDPLGMETAVLAEVPADVPAEHAGGFTAEGDPVESWTLAAWAPAGGIQCTIDDLIAFAEAVIDGPLSDSDAQNPHGADAEAGTIGWLWGIGGTDEEPLLSHNGGTGGFTSALYIDPVAGTAGIALVNSQTDVDALAQRLLRLAG